ncbi:ParM/StbA family protein [Gloeothece verrucosa]|uniref:Actin-like protein N-terminal domain-containing protein n=1 Tax=Gloeothece verrucosa (strain PCC 7822) TaxID=497965 RepID=E0UNR4_GLOV7|nr:ParM/StbA family protein [Gloeothece verrucosa]ADN18594.1 conserved hypothetical protein [Gloeothece verrucosa PCC 7822]
MTGKKKSGTSSRQSLIMAIDGGGSSTKIIGGLNFVLRSVIAMEPEMIQVPRELLSEYDAGVLPKDCAWVGLGGKYLAVGYLARCQATVTPMLSQPKMSLAIPKIAAAVWVLKEMFNLPSQLRLSLATVLPPGEYKDKDNLESALKEALKVFETPTGKMRVNLVEFDCKPEGGGLFMYHKAKRGKENIYNTNVAVVMLGYRNISTLVFNRGKKGEYLTTDLGFAKFIRGVIKETAGYNDQSLTPALALYGDGRSDEPLTKVLRYRDKADKEDELIRLKKAIVAVRRQYEIQVANWLTDVLPPDVGEVLLCGGTADYLKKMLFELFSDKDIYLHAKLTMPDDIQEWGMGNRWADIWCIWDYFCGVVPSTPSVVA